MKEKTTIFVTGGAGYIGSVVVEQLIADGYGVAVFDNLSRGHRAAVHPEALLIEGDLLDKEAIRSAVQQVAPSAIMHFAALAYVGESMHKPMDYFENNVTGSLNLISAAVESGVGKFIFSSSCATYGIPDSVPITEKTPQRPVNPYGESKLIVEKVLKWARSIHSMDVVVLRYFNAAGATETRGEDHDPETHIIPLLLDAAGAPDAFRIFGDQYSTDDGTCVRDYIHVSDLASAHILALKEGLSCSLNLGNGNGFSVLEVVEAARRVVDGAIKAEVVAPRAGDPPALIADNESGRSVLGWEPAHSDLEEMIGDAWNWRLRHPVGYEDCGDVKAEDLT